jgi:predicted enzyme related to lactoylglutathione lyase
MIAGVRYTHTNLVARDWHVLAGFYESVFGCVPVPPERAYSGAHLEALTAVPHAALSGVHLRLPGAGQDGSTLEIFQYEPVAPGLAPAVNRPGLAHIAFAVDSVEAAVREVLSAGGSAVGEVTVLTTPTGARVTACYVTDPEGNIVEVQSWEPTTPRERP